MSDTALRKSIAQAASLFADSKRGIMITDKNYRVKWTNDIELAKGKVQADSTGVTLRLLSKTIPLQETEITIEGRPHYLLCRYDESDMLSLLKSEAADRLYSRFGGRLRGAGADSLSVSSMISDPIESKKASDDLKRQNTKLLSSFVNTGVLIRLINSDRYSEPSALRPYIEPFLDNTMHIAKQNGFEFTYLLEKDIFLKTDIKALRCVIANLIANAFMYNKSPAKKARLEITQKRKSICISLTDNGGGIDENALKQTESPFAGTTGGEGLGLYIARLYTQSEGGEITFTNESGGLNVLIKLPPKISHTPDELARPPYIPYPILLDPEYLILAKAMDTVEGGCFTG